MSRFNSGRFDSGGGGSTDLSFITAGASDILDGKIGADTAGEQVPGTLPDNADADVEVTTLAGTTIPAGKYDGTGKAVLSAAEQAKIIGGNIKKDVVILGETGTLEGASDGSYVEDEYTKVLMHFDGADESTTFTDASGKTWTGEGTAKLSTAQKVIGTASLLLDGNSDYISTPDHADFDFGAGDFTIRCRIRPAAVDIDQVIYSQMTNFENWVYFAIESARLVFKAYSSAATICRIEVPYAITAAGGWYLIEVVRSGSTVYMFVNGVKQVVTAYNPIGTNTLPNVASVITIGARISAGTPERFFGGNIDEFEIAKGIARHTASYIP